ncbi:hypothetical protein [Pseudomonas pseudonitroreducens]|uniref:hypothetical protein n=1 Tax=Pseudomonas pseudonitroreducens TaxID=2892326 RepID=UPI001F23A346|nr:hypothetical protein [Pseudomonas pseudonitroreducens]
MSVSRWIYLSLAVGVLVGCQSQKNDELSYQFDNTESVAKGVPGGAMTETEEVQASVSAVDLSKRTFTLTDDQGNSRTLQAPPEMRNFEQLKVGDRVRAIVTMERLVYLREPGQPAGSGVAGLLATAQPGNKPAMLAADTVEITAVVKSMDTSKRTATLQFADGSQHTVNVRPDVQMKREYLGRQLVMRVTSAVAVSVQPQ